MTEILNIGCYGAIAVLYLTVRGILCGQRKGFLLPLSD